MGALYAPQSQAMLRSVYEAIRPTGFLVGLFPTIFAAAEIGFCEERERWRLDLVDLLHSHRRAGRPGRQALRVSDGAMRGDIDDVEEPVCCGTRVRGL
jgi:hypothetical protein